MDLSEHLKAHIETKGPMSVAEFMSFGLNKFEDSYYVSNNPIGREGDFITAPEISQLFGEIIGAWCANIWQLYGSPKNFNLIELGPGKGTLMADLLRSTKSVKGFHDNLNICFVEINKQLQAKQEAAIAHPRVKWYKSFEEIEENFSIIVANEFFDALPINQYIKLKGRWHSNIVDLNQDKKHLCINYQNTNGELQEYLDKEYGYIPEGGILEISDKSTALMRSITKVLKQESGAALIIDYGHMERKNRDFVSTLQCVKEHKFHPVFKDIGNADLSAYVDFCALEDISKIHGGITYGPITQKDFLSNMYIDVRKDILLSKTIDAGKIDSINSGYLRLMEKDQMGNLFKVMAVTSQKFSAIGF